MPTLLEKGKIILQKWNTQKENTMITNQRSIDYLMQWLKDRIYIRNETPKVKPSCAGSKVLVLRAKTGSGKSTVLPTALFKTFFEDIKKNILITEPSRVTTMDIPFQIIKWTPELKLGVNIGYQTGTVARKPKKGILFATIGILLQYLKILTDEDIMNKFSFMVVDEVHSRSIDVDLVLFYLKIFLIKNWEDPRCPMVILMSGTFDPDIFMRYFKCPKENFIDVEGASYNIEKYFTDYAKSDYLTYICNLIEKIHIDNIEELKTVNIQRSARMSDISFTNVDENEYSLVKVKGNQMRDIIVFLLGFRPIVQLIEMIHKLNANVFSKGIEFSKQHSDNNFKKYTGAKEPEEFYIAPIMMMGENMASGSKDYMDIFSDISNVSVDIWEFDKSGNKVKLIKTVPASRRVIFATNVAETGLTIDTLKYCIDSGFSKEITFNPNYNCYVMTNKPITQASSQQRMGRVGRNAPGIFYACYSSKLFSMLQPFALPNIVQEDISLHILNILINETESKIVESDSKTKDSFQMHIFDQEFYKLTSNKKFEASSLDFIQYPSSDSMAYSIEKLHGLGFIDHIYKPTIFGMYAQKFKKISIENIRLLLSCYNTGAYVFDMITIVAFLEVGNDIGIRFNKYKPRNPLGLKENIALYYYKILFADEFIEYLFIWNDFMKFIEGFNLLDIKKNKMKNNLPELETWCSDNGFKLKGFFRVAEIRGEVFTSLLTTGLNPWYNSLHLPRGSYNLISILKQNFNEGMEEIKKIKTSIYEGYRFNLLVWNSKSKEYIRQIIKVPIKINSSLIKPLHGDSIKQDRPKNIIVKSVLLKEKAFSQGAYEFTGDVISVLDGFVNIDYDFFN
jgi:HrpA-like RNA helicase